MEMHPLTEYKVGAVIAAILCAVAIFFAWHIAKSAPWWLTLFIGILGLCFLVLSLDNLLKHVEYTDQMAQRLRRINPLPSALPAPSWQNAPREQPLVRWYRR